MLYKRFRATWARCARSIDPCTTITCICLRFIYNFLLFVAWQRMKKVHRVENRMKKKQMLYVVIAKRKWIGIQRERERRKILHSAIEITITELIHFVVMKSILKWSIPLHQLSLLCLAAMIWSVHKNVGSYCGANTRRAHRIDIQKPNNNQQQQQLSI